MACALKHLSNLLDLKFTNAKVATVAIRNKCAFCATKLSAMGITLLQLKACTTIHFNGDQNVPALIWRVLAVNILTNGMCVT